MVNRDAAAEALSGVADGADEGPGVSGGRRGPGRWGERPAGRSPGLLGWIARPGPRQRAGRRRRGRYRSRRHRHGDRAGPVESAVSLSGCAFRGTATTPPVAKVRRLGRAEPERACSGTRRRGRRYGSILRRSARIGSATGACTRPRRARGAGGNHRPPRNRQSAACSRRSSNSSRDRPRNRRTSAVVEADGEPDPRAGVVSNPEMSLQQRHVSRGDGGRIGEPNRGPDAGCKEPAHNSSWAATRPDAAPRSHVRAAILRGQSCSATRCPAPGSPR